MKKLLYTFLYLFMAMVTSLNAQTPDWIWMRYLNSTQLDNFTDVNVDNNGNAYVCGTFFGPTVTFAGQTFNSVENSAAILVKRDPAGGLVWARMIDGASCTAVEVDVEGNSLITGYFSTDSIDFGNTVLYNPARFTTSFFESARSALFVVKYDPSGTVLWARSFDNQLSTQVNGWDITTDTDGNCYVAGTFLIYTSEPGAEITVNGISLEMYPGSGSEDMFLMKYDANGVFQWIRTAGGPSFEEPRGLEIDGNGNVIVMGGFSGNIFELDSNTILTQNNPLLSSRSDFFIAKYAPDGALISGKQSFGGGSARCEGISIDSDGNYFVSGYFNSDTLTFDGAVLINSDTTPFSSDNPPFDFNADIFLFKINSADEVVWAKVFGNSANNFADDYGKGVATDSEGNCYLTGSYYVDINFGDINLVSAGFSDVFVVKIDPDGNPVWAQTAGGSASERGSEIAVDQENNVFVSGSYDSGTALQPLNFGSIQATYTGSSSTGFLGKIGFNTVGSNPQAGTQDVTLYPNPASSVISIRGDAKLLERISGFCIIDLLGKEITRSATSFNPNIMAIDGSIPDGLYLLQLIDKEGSALAAEPLVILHQ